MVDGVTNSNVVGERNGMEMMAKVLEVSIDSIACDGVFDLGRISWTNFAWNGEVSR